MIISVIDPARTRIADEDLQQVRRAVNWHIESDSAPSWSLAPPRPRAGRGGKTQRPVINPGRHVGLYDSENEDTER